jgi:hypothetical protein
MKHALFTTLLLIALSRTNAQSFRWGINAGAVMAQVHTVADNDKENSDSRWGFNAGIMADLNIGKNFSFQPGLSFLQKGGRATSTVGDPPAKTAFILNYLELPLNIVYHVPAKKGHLIVGLGPSIGYALSGKVKVSLNGETTTSKISFGGGGDEFRHFEFGANLLAGYEWSTGWMIMANYNLGLSNQLNGDQGKWKNRYFGIRLGYFLSGNH